jgi:hypothetical protein
LWQVAVTEAGWVFDTTPKNESMAALADFFGDYITLCMVESPGRNIFNKIRQLYT